MTDDNAVHASVASATNSGVGFRSMAAIASAISHCRPARPLLLLLLAWLVLQIPLLFLRWFDYQGVVLLTTFWWGGGIAIALTLCVDLLRGTFADELQLTRRLPSSLFLATPCEVKIHIENRGEHRRRISIYDHFSQQLQTTAMPVDIELAARETRVLAYQVVPVVRGNADFSTIETRLLSRWSFWEFKRHYGAAQLVRVYPNFSNIARIAALGLEHHAGLAGIHLQQRRGEGLDFNQLREFRVGDALRQIDWKASSRYSRPISREYQEERDQDIVFLLDCGRRMRAKDGDLSHFDHALNAVLVTAYVALRQGDAVGLGTFAGSSNRWVAPVKGPHQIQSLMQQVYDLHSSTENSDLLQAATELMARYRKRSLIVLVSTLREEDKADALRAVQLLTRRHIVIVANLREEFIDRTLARPPGDFQSALNYLSAHTFNAGCVELTQWLKASGVMCADDIPPRLHIAMVDQYLALKRAGVI